MVGVKVVSLVGVTVMSLVCVKVKSLVGMTVEMTDWMKDLMLVVRKVGMKVDYLVQWMVG